MAELLPFLVLAGALGIVGDATIRYGLGRSAWSWLVVGSSMLVVYGLAVTLNRSGL